MNEMLVMPMIVGFVSDLMLSQRIESTAEKLGFQVRWIERAEQIAPLNADAPWRQPAEHLVGPGAALVKKIVEWQPALIIFDLGNDELPWAKWMALIKSAPATRRTPVICYGPHVDMERFRIAKQAGADVVLARSRFVQDLPGLLGKYARIPDGKVIAITCQEPLSDLAIQGLILFNRREYFKAHEILEEAWKEDPTPGRELYRAIIQIAVAYLQIERENYNGAVKMFLRVRQWIEPLPEVCRGVEVARLKEAAYRINEKLIKLGPGRIGELNSDLFEPVYYEIPK